MSPIDSYLILGLFLNLMIGVVLALDLFVLEPIHAWFVRKVNKLSKRYTYARGYGASRRVALRITLRRG